jgi:hypothetical protein
MNELKKFTSEPAGKETQAAPQAKTPFLKLRPPEGDTIFGYKVKIIGEPRQVRTKYGPKPFVDVELLETTDDRVKPGFFTLVPSPVLEDRLRPFGWLAAKILLIANTGKPTGKNYFNFKVQEVK